MVQGRVQLGYSSHIGKVGGQGYMLTLQALMYIEGRNGTGGPISNYTAGTLNPEKGAKPNLNCGEVHTHAS